MASTYSTSLKIQLMGNGEDSGTWGSITNTNWNLMEQAVSGVQTITMANANYTLTSLNGVPDEARNMVLVVNGTNSAIRQIIAPLAPKFYIVSNQTVGGYAITIGGASGSIITIPTATTVQVYCDGTNFYSAQTSSAGSFNVNGNLTVNGTSTLTGATSVGGLLTASSGIASTTGNFSGNLASLGSVSGATGVFGAVSGTTGTFTGAVSGTTGTFSGAVSGTTGTFSGALSSAGATISGTLGVIGSANIAINCNAGVFNGTGTGLNGTATSLNVGGYSTYLKVNSATNSLLWGWSGTNLTLQVDSTNYGNTLPCNISGNSYSATTATTATTANSYNASNNLNCNTLRANGSYTGYAGTGGDAMVALSTAGSVGYVTAVNLANNTYRWLKIGEGSPVLIGATSVPFSASLTVGSLNGNGGVWCNNGTAGNQGGAGWAMVNADGQIGAWRLSGGYLETYANSTAIGINFFVSDESVKENIQPTTYNAIDSIKEFKFIEFDYKKEYPKEGHVKCGISAQQVQTFAPNLIQKQGDHLAPKIDEMLYVALKAIQELETKVATLEAKLAK